MTDRSKQEGHADVMVIVKFGRKGYEVYTPPLVSSREEKYALYDELWRAILPRNPVRFFWIFEGHTYLLDKGRTPSGECLGMVVYPRGSHCWMATLGFTRRGQELEFESVHISSGDDIAGGLGPQAWHVQANMRRSRP